MHRKLRFLLLQVRRATDPMRSQEVDCFVRALQCEPHQIDVLDLLRGVPRQQQLDRVDVVLLGGSGDYSVAEGGPWLSEALQSMRKLYDQGKPTFASCWGFQAMARALGGTVVTDLSCAELGSVPVHLTDDGLEDPVFGPLGASFYAQMGHQDVVDTLPGGVQRLAFSDKVANQAFCVPGKPIYCTQFHPELERESLIQRVYAYPRYVQRIGGITIAQFIKNCRETPETFQLLRRFVEHVFG